MDSFRISYTETGKSFDTILADFVANSTVNQRRDSSGADLAALIINQTDYCGLYGRHHGEGFDRVRCRAL